MSRSVLFLPAARQEVASAQDWRAGAGLGLHFREALDAQVLRISANPLQFPLRLQDVRSAKLRRFPYSVFFRVTEDQVAIIACFHASRDPMVWTERV